MRTDFKVYKRKIHVWCVQNSNVPDSDHKRALVYMYSTHAYKTCKAAIAAAKAARPAFEFKANFAN